MANAAQWLDGARPRTLYMAVAPVVAGTGVAAAESATNWARAALALVVALALQVGVNYANDYSDGIRGTDAVRVGPRRLVGSGTAAASHVLAAALASFVVAGVAGLILAALAGWWLVAVGVGCVLAAWTYTGGGRPYGYRALGEVAVFTFFGLVAVGGTAYVQTGQLTRLAAIVAVPIGLLATALLVANNLRDIPGDTVAGKRTLAVRLGDRRTRALYLVLVGMPFLLLPVVEAVADDSAALAALAALPLLAAAVVPIVGGATGTALVPTLRTTGQLTLLYAVLLAVGLAAG